MADGSGLEILVFEVGGIACGLRRGDVRELLALPQLWRPPGTPKPLAGFFNLGGRAVAAIDLAVLLGIEDRSDLAGQGVSTRGKIPAGDKLSAESQIYRHLMLVDRLGGPGPAALLVDRVRDFVRVEPPRISPVRAAATLNGCVEAEIDRDNALVHLLSLERLLLAEEAQSLAELRRKAQDRLGEWAPGA